MNFTVPSDYGNQTISFGELCSEPRPMKIAMGFCDNPKHLRINSERWRSVTPIEEFPEITWEVKGFSRKATKNYTDKKRFSCECGRALFWSKDYNEVKMNEAQRLARKESGL